MDIKSVDLQEFEFYKFTSNMKDPESNAATIADEIARQYASSILKTYFFPLLSWGELAQCVHVFIMSGKEYLTLCVNSEGFEYAITDKAPDEHCKQSNDFACQKKILEDAGIPYPFWEK